jgi:hypothetical protein
MKTDSEISRIPTNVRNQLEAYASLKGEQVLSSMIVINPTILLLLVNKFFHLDDTHLCLINVYCYFRWQLKSHQMRLIRTSGLL